MLHNIVKILFYGCYILFPVPVLHQTMSVMASHTSMEIHAGNGNLSGSHSPEHWNKAASPTDMVTHIAYDQMQGREKQLWRIQ